MHPAAPSPQELHQFLTPHLKPRPPLHITYTNNRITLLTLRRTPLGHRHLRIDQRFAHAPKNLWQDLAHYLRTQNKAAWKNITAYLRNLPPRTTPTRLPPLRTQGRHVDLLQLHHTVNQNYFQGLNQSRITWGKNATPSRSRSRRSCRFASYDHQLDLIRVHPLLDQPHIPQAFLQYVVYHEILHALHPIQIRNNRRVIHSPQFRRLDQQFPQWKQMQQIARQLLRAATLT